MSYIEQNLKPGEKIIFSTKIHPIEYMPAALVAIFSLLFYSAPGIMSFFLFVAFVLAIMTFLTIQSSEFAVTTEKVVIKRGIVNKELLEMPFAKIESIYMNETLGISNLTKSANLIIKGSGGTPTTLKNIAEAKKFREEVNNKLPTNNDKLTQASA